MGVFEKLKNALFEVEYVEVDEPPKKEKKEKPKEKNKEKEEKPIAKKIVLPGKKHEKVEEIKEEVLKDDNFEARPVNEEVKETKHEEFKFMDDNDFKVEDEFMPTEQPEIVEVIGTENSDEVSHLSRQERNKSLNTDYYSEKTKITTVEEKRIVNVENNSDENESMYKPEEESSIYKNERPKAYGMDSPYNVSVHQYGTYDRREEKTVFKPSPIISPIYGILDKNYRKEDVVQKKEVRLSSYTRSNMSVDDIRNKAYGNEKEEVVENKIFEVEEDEDENLLVDLSNESDRPEVKELTMGDAMEYFQDLGLEYNVDYVDASSGKNVKRDTENLDDLESDIKKEIEKKEEDKPIEVIQPKEDTTTIKEEVPTLPEQIEDSKEDLEEKTNVVEIKDESKDNNIDSLEDDDNLFDLIDSMYKEEN